MLPGWGTVGWGQALTMGHHNQGGLLGSGTLTWAHQDGIKVQAPCGSRKGVLGSSEDGGEQPEPTLGTHRTGDAPARVGAAGCGCPS